MKQITLIRHAKVDIDNSQKISASLLKKWVEAYDSAPIHSESFPSKETIDIAQKADVVVTSTLRRAIDSANVLGVEIYEQNSLFNEAAIPEANISFFKLKPKRWLVILRLMLLVGLGKKDVSLKASKAQAKNAAKRLRDISHIHDHVVLVGHGGMNWLIGKELIKEGWILEGQSSHKNWGASVLTFR
ncbi:hypothetical protein C9926_01845 [Sulfurovum lithotrophicum]|nr:hypothetical protein C9926_01845 [Sulfurovum lithotrophicum]